MHFNIFKRNEGHWDVTSGGERAFRIRGGPAAAKEWGGDGSIVVLDERTDPTRPHPRASLHFPNYDRALLYIADQLLGDMSK
jgi:hypothetical protein